jgi:hypothetical protein
MSLPYESCIFCDSPPRPLERRRYSLARVDQQHGTGWGPDASSFVLFSFAAAAPLFFIPRLQSLPPPGPRKSLPILACLPRWMNCGFTTRIWRGRRWIYC